MTKNLPDKWLRLAIGTALDSLQLDGITIPYYDYRAGGPDVPEMYVVMEEQSNNVDKNNKCEYLWESEIVLQIFASYPLAGNPGSRVDADDILEEVKNLLNNLVLDEESGLKIVTQTMSFAADSNSTSSTLIIYRKFLRLTFTIQ